MHECLAFKISSGLRVGHVFEDSKSSVNMYEIYGQK